VRAPEAWSAGGLWAGSSEADNVKVAPGVRVADRIKPQSGRPGTEPLAV